ncbi:5-hydroxytryptamine receptor 1A [Lingula anatina]|uniref:5-hydroxytryptamine receptor 1A n=1 Tax=Lingula anatina TaxID=7574 RepID=A0A1S3GY13_LINAN|nr:5-hydroxytryptamine receptor 1A [Lingula anatina]XP_013378760.1 5-hydroxytryptamine receptor 1A [Lingula anatina]XP_013378761.1 5-hydroxytryptamine receptor 1A [Lingula anatina]XP_013378762.1 5-hydroxytryptamine receptor 1A [Lingula anatina]XP_013378763.1 5-hydroxytryptamine receptor 1A [Lingula anatina]XP_013378764.1 5-hydroxytryptamine receptor 1A [Lingula anatina]XP_013378765.1 5-hydroxytryptamine receptor 1A [Lingula anatina]XP_013378766.1 5-hydroxytryptamine receptor 1A [Lingula anat|eukprot:XP_013378759.1 5-hydroxytryptamine receptor 1A [Lingula anatina]
MMPPEGLGPVNGTPLLYHNSTPYNDEVETIISLTTDVEGELLQYITYNDTRHNYSYTATESNSTNSTMPVPLLNYPVWQAVLISLCFAALIIGTAVGNILVCMAVGLVRRLRTPSNLLIVSLAVSDLLVALLVMPLSALYELQGRWTLGHQICDMWTSLDVLLCTASILNLCMISVDRYFAITRPLQYAMKRTPKRMAIMVSMVWIASALISIVPLFGFRKTNERGTDGQCIINQSIFYQIYATLGAFYLPLSVMIIVYFKIYMVSLRLAEADHRSAATSSILGQEALLRPKLSNEENHNWPTTTPNGDLTLKVKNNEDTYKQIQHHINAKVQSKSKSHRPWKFLKKCPCRFRRIKSHHRESKATKTLGVIMGGFTLCWLPFFILALVRPFCGDSCFIPNWVTSLLTWLGYANSFFNPVIYARFNKEFRTPFKEILCFRCKNINTRVRSESYVQQYGSPEGFHSHAHSVHRLSIQHSPRLAGGTSAATVVKLNDKGHPSVVKYTNGGTQEHPTEQTEESKL